MQQQKKEKILKENSFVDAFLLIYVKRAWFLFVFCAIAEYKRRQF